MAGKLTGLAKEDNDAIYRKNIEYAARILAGENLLCVIEPINKYSVPNYYLNSYNKGNDLKRPFPSIKRLAVRTYCFLVSYDVISSSTCSVTVKFKFREI